MKIETPILRRLGPVPFWRGEKRCLDALERIYRRAVAHAEARLSPRHEGEAAALSASRAHSRISFASASGSDSGR